MGKIALIMGLILLVLTFVGWSWGTFVFFCAIGVVIVAGFIMGVCNSIKRR